MVAVLVAAVAVIVLTLALVLVVAAALADNGGDCCCLLWLVFSLFALLCNFVMVENVSSCRILPDAW